MLLADALADEHEELRLAARQRAAGAAQATIPERFGGAGLGVVEAAVLAEELGRVLSPLPLISTAMAVEALEGGDDVEWLPRIAQGEVRATLVVDPRRVLDPDADVLVVGTRAVRAEVTRLPTLDPTRPLGSVALEAEPAPPRAVDIGRVLLAAELLGVADRSLELAVDHAKTRVQFGRPIGSFQAIKHTLAETLARIESARSASRWAAWVADHSPGELTLAAAMALSVCGEVATRAAGDALQVFGGIGFTWEHPIGGYFKRARAGSTLLGTPGELRAVVAGRIGT